MFVLISLRSSVFKDVKRLQTCHTTRPLSSFGVYRRSSRLYWCRSVSLSAWQLTSAARARRNPGEEKGLEKYDAAVSPRASLTSCSFSSGAPRSCWPSPRTFRSLFLLQSSQVLWVVCGCSLSTLSWSSQRLTLPVLLARGGSPTEQSHWWGLSIGLKEVI